MRSLQQQKLFCSLLLVVLGLSARTTLAANTLTGPGSSSHPVGSFTVLWNNGRLQIQSGTRVVWDSIPNQNFVSAGKHNLAASGTSGSFSISENLSALCTDQQITSLVPQAGALDITGNVSGNADCNSAYTLTLREVIPGHLQFLLVFDNTNVNFSEFTYASTSSERFYGFGEQFSHLNLKGKVVPILSQEGGIGRGREPITSMINLGSAGSGGNDLTTYYAVPQYITNTNKSLFLEDSDYAVFDLSNPSAVRVRVFDRQIVGRILAGDSMLDLITRFTEYTGRMRPTPSWFNEGAILGLQGGTSKVNHVLTEIERRGTPVAGVWLQDWVGKRTTFAGSQLWWNWQVDPETYPDWNGLVDRITAHNGRMLCYVNPKLVDRPTASRNMYAEAASAGYFVKNARGGIYEIKNTDFSGGLIDLTNPATVTWIKDVIKTELIANARCSGWMHDYGEAMPFDAVLYSGQPAAEYHNQYTVDWSRIAREAIVEAGRGDDIVFFNRAGYTRTPAYSTMVWQGDQTVTWDEDDGFKTAILATITSGFSGVSLSHSDIGGYTNVSLNADLGYNREQELLLRWMEFSAFTSAFRTHEGLRPEANAQFYSNETTFAQFDKFARIFKALAFYRTQLMQEASTKGWPLVRHPMLHYPQEGELATLTDHFMLGTEILVAPIINKDVYNEGWKKVYFPDKANTTWVHLLTGKKYGKNSNAPLAPWWLRLTNPASGNWQWVYAPVGRPPAFYKQGSTIAAQLEANLISLGVK